MSIAEVNGTEMHYQVRGDGPPLLLVAGTGYPGATWLLPEFMDELVKVFRVITFDHRGTGGTPGREAPYSTRQFAEDARALLRELRLGPTHVLGHSMGGRVAQWMALDEPRLLRSLILAASGPGGNGNPGQPVGLPVDAMAAMVEQGYRGYMERHIRSTFFTPAFAEACPERVRWLVEAFWGNRPGVRDYLKHIAARQNHDTSILLPSIHVPTLVLVGDADTRRGPTGSHLEQSHFLHANIPGAVLDILPGLSHGMFWQGPDLVVEALAHRVNRGTAVGAATPGKRSAR
jgi:pimeloyl-ACP methyl ester carboxylesterase